MKTTKILIIDDDQDFLTATEALLKQDGLNIRTAVNFQSAIDSAKEFGPEIIFCDMMMQEIDSGVQIAKRLKEEDCQAAIYLTSSISDQMRTNCDIHKLGFSGTVQKPIDLAFVLSLLD